MEGTLESGQVDWWELDYRCSAFTPLFRDTELHTMVPAGLVNCRSRGVDTRPKAADISRNDVSSDLMVGEAVCPELRLKGRGGRLTAA